MGIRGLSSFIQDRSESCLKQHLLRDTPIIIDGNNFYHFLFINSPKRNASFGGDYNYFREYAQQVLLLFKQCNVTPIVVFDGGLDANDRKQQTRLGRARQKIIASVKVKPSNQERMAVFPLMLRLVLIQLLKKEKIEVVQCQYEADNEIAALGRGMNCPVVSNDSDFYIMDVQVIPLSLIDLNVATKSANGFGIDCKLFSMSDFLVFIGHKDASIFPLLGTLLGNDYVDKNLFEAVFSQIRMPKTKKMNDQHKKVQGLLDFLKGQSVEEAIERILSFIKKTHHTDVKVAIRTSLEAYACENTASLKSPQDLKDKIVAGIVAENLPEWFALQYASSLIPPWVLEVTISHSMPLQSQVESANRDYSFACCFDLLQAIALICWDEQTNNKLKTQLRSRSELVFKQFRPTKADFAIPLPPLSSVKAMTHEDKEKLFYDIMLQEDTGRLQEQAPELRLIFACVIRWARRSQCEVRSFHVDGLLAGLIHFCVVEKKIGKIRSAKRLERITNAKSGAGVDDYIKAARNTLKFQEIDGRMLCHDVNFDKDIVHVLAEFQATYYLAQTLRVILDLDLPILSPSEFYCGTFVYRAVSQFKGYNRLVLADKLYGNSDSPVFACFKSYTDFIYELTPATVMEWSPHGPDKPRKRNRKNASKKENPVQSSSASSQEEDSEENANNLLANRFGVLSLT